MPSRMTPIARRLRKDAMSAERRLWMGVRREALEGFKFRRQVPLGPYLADFACLEARLVIEIDGATHSSDAEIGRDASRQAALNSFGYAVLRFHNDEVYHNLEGVLETIRLKLRELRPRENAERT